MTRTGYTGSEVYLSLVDRHEAPFSGQLRHLTLDTLCTNRDLAVQLSAGARLEIEDAAPLELISCLEKPTYPAYPPIEGATLWALVSNLSSRFL